jgi:hypothetical protein
MNKGFVWSEEEKEKRRIGSKFLVQAKIIKGW